MAQLNPTRGWKVTLLNGTAEVEKPVALCFVFSSRRRHTRLQGDWSSDVCSSDLQQARFDAFVTRSNQDRPHQALGMKVPADVYARSSRVYRGREDLTYPFHDATFTVTHCGRICFHGRKINLSHVLAGHNVGVAPVGDGIWLV